MLFILALFLNEHELYCNVQNIWLQKTEKNGTKWSKTKVKWKLSKVTFQTHKLWHFVMLSNVRSNPNICSLLCTNTGYFYFHPFSYEREICASRSKHLSAPKYIFSRILHRLQTVWNQTKSKKNLQWNPNQGKYRQCWSIVVWKSLNKHCSPTKAQTTFKKCQTFYFLSVISLKVYTKIISI